MSRTPEAAVEPLPQQSFGTLLPVLVRQLHRRTPKRGRRPFQLPWITLPWPPFTWIGTNGSCWARSLRIRQLVSRLSLTFSSSTPDPEQSSIVQPVTLKRRQFFSTSAADGQADLADARFNRLLQRRRVVGLAVANRAEVVHSRQSLRRHRG